ncbi:TetR/AcrR family transcriptional regulator [Aeromicrobium halocynthiae]|uniref:TetR/AcrR family transcriptional regulator n=1 Tax=Aeromicrobium halocynthiae TaxID=560557 RepID=A0ABP5HIY2_9ACTN
MPRFVDHEARRREIAAALWRVVRTQGVEQTSVRAVAAEAGWSAGALRHYFATQDDLHAFALRSMLEQTVVRVRRWLASEDGSPTERAVTLVEELLPLDDERRSECLVWYAFADRARLDAVLGDVRRQGWLGTRHIARLAVAEAARAARPLGLEDELADPALEARAARLHVLIDGWAVHGISYPDLVDASALHDQVVAEVGTWS